MSGRSREEWRAHALRVLGVCSEHAADGAGEHGQGILPHPSTSIRDQADQTEFGLAVDQATATIVTTADINEMIRIPDAATLLRATPESLRRCEQEAAELLRYIQQDIQLQLQEAGVTFKPTPLDAMQPTAGRGVSFAHRRQLAFQTASSADAPGPQRGEYWRFAAEAKRFRLYDDALVRKAAVMEQLRTNVDERHRAYEEIERSLREAQEAVALSQANAAAIRRDAAKPAKRYQLQAPSVEST